MANLTKQTISGICCIFAKQLFYTITVPVFFLVEVEGRVTQAWVVLTSLSSRQLVLRLVVVPNHSRSTYSEMSTTQLPEGNAVPGQPPSAQEIQRKLNVAQHKASLLQNGLFT